MATRNFLEVTMSMLPHADSHTQYKNYFTMVDNMEAPTSIVTDYEGIPIKLSFGMVGFCLSGEMRVRINLQEIVVGKNCLILLPPGAILDKVSFSEDYRMGAIFFNEYHHDYLPLGNLRMRLTSVIKNGPLLIHMREESMRQVVANYHHVRSAIGDERLNYKDDVVAGYMQGVTIYMLNDLEEQLRNTVQPKTSRAEQLFQQFYTLARQHYSEHHEVSFYADRLCITAKYLGVVVTRVSGRRPIEWIRDLIILDAKAMILSGRYTMQQVSDALHFPNPSFFGKYFKEYVGCTPGQYAETV